MSWVVIEETLRRHATNLAVIAFMIAIALFGFGAALSNRPGSMWPALVTLFAIVIGAGVIGPEFSSGTLQLILVKPINRAVYLMSRVAGVVLVVWSAALLGFVCEVAARAYTGEVPWKALGTALFNTMIGPLLLVALLALLGSVTRAYFNLAALVALQMLLGVLLAFRRKLPASVGAAGQFVHDNLFPETPFGFSRDWLLLVLANAAIAILLACLAFRRREVPYGAD